LQGLVAPLTTKEQGKYVGETTEKGKEDMKEVGPLLRVVKNDRTGIQPTTTTTL